MVSEKIIRGHLAKIKKVVKEAVSKSREAAKIRDDAFAEVLSKLDQDHQKLVNLVKVAKYELIFDDLIRSGREEDEESVGGEYE